MYVESLPSVPNSGLLVSKGCRWLVRVSKGPHRMGRPLTFLLIWGLGFEVSQSLGFLVYMRNKGNNLVSDQWDVGGIK